MGCRCWQHRTPDDASVDLNALERRGSPLYSPLGPCLLKKIVTPLDSPPQGLCSAQSWVALVGTLGFCEGADMQDFPRMHGPKVVLR